MLISQQARAGIPVNHDFHPERGPNHQEWSSYSTTATLSSSERQEHMFLLKRPDHMRCGHASIPRFPTLVGMLYQESTPEHTTHHTQASPNRTKIIAKWLLIVGIFGFVMSPIVGISVGPGNPVYTQ